MRPAFDSATVSVADYGNWSRRWSDDVRPRLLIIDDHATIAETLRGLLEDEGYEVVTAANGAAGLVAVARAQPALVITDIMMPVLDGRGFSKRLRASPDTATLPVILVSAAEGLSPVDDEHAVLVRKPFGLELLLEQIERFLRKANP